MKHTWDRKEIHKEF